MLSCFIDLSRVPVSLNDDDDSLISTGQLVLFTHLQLDSRIDE